jgi:FixJ family two-component response regulator
MWNDPVSGELREYPVTRSKPLIAVVDDDESVCRALKRLLQSLGMESQTFASGGEFFAFIDAIPSFHPDCIVLDLHMPGMNGLDVQERLIHSGNPLSVIFITAYDDPATRKRALEAGAVAFLRKPFSDETLIRALNEAVQGGSGA